MTLLIALTLLLSVAPAPSAEDDVFDRVKHGYADSKGVKIHYKQNYPAPPYVEDTSPLVKVKPPVLLFHGLNDTALLHGALNRTWEWLDKDLTLVTVPGAGHWVQEDAAELVSGMMQAWLGVQAPK
jgi:pimeloyl-ACP methyl ester carboxylesterase